MKPYLAAALALPLSLGAPFAGSAAAGSSGACRDPAVLTFITERFEHKASHYLGTGASIFEIRDMRMNRYEPPTHDISSVAREYCHAGVSLTDGRRRDLWYVVEDGWGFAGLGRNVEFCISGLDPWHVYGADCRSLR